MVVLGVLAVMAVLTGMALFALWASRGGPFEPPNRHGVGDDTTIAFRGGSGS